MESALSSRNECPVLGYWELSQHSAYACRLTSGHMSKSSFCWGSFILWPGFVGQYSLKMIPEHILGSSDR